jgi:thiol-disulfide isomerase/thioredoxin
MKKLFIFITLALLFCGVANAANPTPPAATKTQTTIAAPKKPATDVADNTLYFVDGTSIKMSELKGKWVLVNFWAVWCGPCHEEIPELNRLAKNYANKIKLYGVNPEQLEDAQLVKQIGRMQIEFPVLRRESARALGLRTASVLPTTYVINPQGKVVKTLIGSQTVQTILSAINFTGADE